MENIKSYENFKNGKVNEGFWDNIFGKPTISQASKDSVKGKGFSHTGGGNTSSREDNYIMFDGEKFYPEQIVYADYNDLGNIPRVEAGKLIIANPSWSL
jgi:hypothetical protein